MLNSLLIKPPTKHLFHSYVERNANYAGGKEILLIIYTPYRQCRDKATSFGATIKRIGVLHVLISRPNVMHRVIVNLAFVERRKKILGGKNFLFPFTCSTPRVMVTQARQHREFPSRILAIACAMHIWGVITVSVWEKIQSYRNHPNVLPFGVTQQFSLVLNSE